MNTLKILKKLQPFHLFSQSHKMGTPFLLLILHLFLSIHFQILPINANTEVRALMEMKSSLDPENKYLSSWTIDKDPCDNNNTFIGVVCNEHRKVANISLESKGLTGKISPAVAGLKCLSGLYLHYNSLTGEIPVEIANLTELTDLYLNVNNFSGRIPPELGNMANIQVLQLSGNQFTGPIPKEIGLMKKLNVLALEYNKLSGLIPTSFGDLGMLKRLYLSFNQLSGPIPIKLSFLPQLEVLDVQNNNLSGVVPPALQRLNVNFHFNNNPFLCGNGISSLRQCTSLDQLDIQTSSHKPGPAFPQAAYVHLHCNHTHCSKSSSKFPKIAIMVCGTAFAMSLLIVATLGVFFYRRRKQKISNTSEMLSDDRSVITQESYRSTSPLVSHEKRVSEDNCHGICAVIHDGLKFNLEEIESATHHFSEDFLLGKSNVSSVYRGVLKDGSLVAIKSINETRMLSEPTEFMKGLRLLTSLKHENLVRLRGFCCSKGRGECFLVYDFAVNGNLGSYLDVVAENCSSVLDWGSRVSIIKGIAKGLNYLHSNDANKPSILHQNLCVEKVFLDQDFTPLISDGGLLKLLANDVVYSVVKDSAAFGYMAPEYVTTGRFTEKSDVYAFGVIILQVLSGKCKLTNSMMYLEGDSCRFEDFLDRNLGDAYSGHEATMLTKIALDCTNEEMDSRPTMASVIEELEMMSVAKTEAETETRSGKLTK